MNAPRFLLLKLFGIVVIILTLAIAGTMMWDYLGSPNGPALFRWAMGHESDRSSLVTTQRERCEGAPFILPADGFIGLLFNDPNGPYSKAAPHQGIDIFSNTDPGITPVYAAYDGFITRESEWRSTLIQRVPDDPLNPGTQVWLYYTHMADEQGNDFIEEYFQPGTRELFVTQGTLLGYTGNYNGNSLRDVWVHLHFSIVKDDGTGQYTNELEFANTIDPSPYLGLPLNYACGAQPIQCGVDISPCTVP